MIKAAASLLLLLAMPSVAPAQSCVGNSVAVQVLGSGGPQINPERASASYLLWVDGQSKLLVDAGGGAFLRFGQARGNLNDLAMIAISHLHPDHVSDLPAILWLSAQARKAPLPISGPSGNDVAPDFATFLTRLFDAKTGAFEVLGGTFGAPGRNGVRLEPTVIDTAKAQPSMVFDGQGMTVTASGIPHGNMPALAYRVETHGMSIVFSTDQNGTDPRFVDFAKGQTFSSCTSPLPPVLSSPLHAAPAVVGRIAQQAGVGRLIVSHIGQFDLDAAVADLKKSYSGPLTVGADLQCTPVQ